MKKGSIVFLIVSLLILTQISLSLSLSEYNLSYDSNGNLIQDLNKYYEYDGFNQLKLVRENNSSGRIISQYFYDADGNRIEKIDFNLDVSNETIYYIGRNFIQIINSSGVFNETYYHDETDLVAKKDNDGKIYYYHPDHLGSTNIVTNESGDVVENTSYQPYGEIIGGGNSRYLYTGKEKDADTGLYYYGARYYNPNQKQFIQPDSIIGDIYNPQDLNKYSYVRNNPYKYVDPSGKEPVSIILAGLVIVGLVDFTISAINSYQQGNRNFGTIYGVGATSQGKAVGETLTTPERLVTFAGSFALGTEIFNGLKSLGIGTKTLGISSESEGMSAGRYIWDYGDTMENTLNGNNIKTILTSNLPKEARDIIDLINKGGPFKYRQDGSVWQNRPLDITGQSALPKKPSGYYKEYTVDTRGSYNRGPQRIVQGKEGEIYYTNNHYKTFRQVKWD